MKFKKLRYNIIVVGLIAIVSCCVAFPLIVGGGNSTNQGQIDEPGIEEPIDDPIIDPEDPEDPDDNDDEDNEVDSGFEYYKAADLIAYSVNLLYNGKGYSSTYSQVCLNTADALGTKISVPQYSKGKITRSGNKSLQETFLWSSYTGIGSDQTQNFFQFYYTDKDSDKFIDGSTNNYNVDAMTYDAASLKFNEMSYAEGMNKWLVLYGDSFPIKTTKKDTIFSDKTTGNYREIKVSYDVKSLSKNVKEFFGTTGQMSNINYTGLEMTYKINIKTGKMYSITRTEKLSGKAAGFNAVTSCTTKQTFTSVDKEQNIKIPGKEV